MAKNYRSKLTGVFGYPVDENPTVAAQEAAFRDKGIDWRYLTLLVKPEDLEDAFRGLRAMNFDGMNLTVPHKIAGMKYVDEVTEGAKLIGAINTIVRKGDKLIGHNTDGQGMVIGMQKAGIDLAGKRLVVLGAGGASRAICVECALAGAASITILNIDRGPGEDLAAVINNNTACKAEFILWEGTAHIPSCDILINATSVGLYPDPNCPNICYDDITADMIVQDVIPNPAQTLFLDKAKERGAKTLDGLSMLVYQGAIGFELWTGEKANVAVMKAALEQANAEA